MATGWLSGGFDRSDVLPDSSEADQQFVGGMKVGGLLRSFNATLPLAVLELHTTGLRIRARGRFLQSVAPLARWTYRTYRSLEVESSVSKEASASLILMNMRPSSSPSILRKPKRA